MDRVSQEVAKRVESLEKDYPFVVGNRPLRMTLKDVKQLTSAHWMYLFLLLLSGDQDKTFSKSDKLSEFMREGRVLFHACASIGVAGLLRSAQTVWFGFPRPEGDGFLEALQALCTKLQHFPVNSNRKDSQSVRDERVFRH
jgi:hypothetical protein